MISSSLEIIPNFSNPVQSTIVKSNIQLQIVTLVCSRPSHKSEFESQMIVVLTRTLPIGRTICFVQARIKLMLNHNIYIYYIYCWVIVSSVRFACCHRESCPSWSGIYFSFVLSCERTLLHLILQSSSSHQLVVLHFDCFSTYVYCTGSK